MKTPSGKCIAQVYQRHPDKKWLLNFGLSPPNGVKPIEERDSVDDLPPLALADLTGKHVRPGQDREHPGGVIQRVHGLAIGGNKLVIRGKSTDPEGLCLEEP